MKIGIIGNGVVGSATGKALAPHVDEVRYWDRLHEKCTHGFVDTVACDLVFACLPTPQLEGYLRCDTEWVEGFFSSLYSSQCKQNFVLRSTVPVGFTRRMRDKYGLVNLVHSPEFLTARTAEHDAANPTRLLIGDPTCKHTDGGIEGTGCLSKLLGLHRVVWPYMGTWCMTSDESEFVKLMQNAHSAVKVSFFNEMRCFSDKHGLDWERCLAALLAGGWVNPMHTQVPGPDGKRGFGGSCLPKDLGNLIQCGLDADLAMLVCSAAGVRNEKVDRK